MDEKEVIEKARIAAEVVVEQARQAAADLVEKAKVDARAMLEATAQAAKEKMFIDITRIPLICQSITGIHDEMKVINDKLDKEMKTINDKLDKKFVTKTEHWPIKTLVYGAVGIMLTAMVYNIVTSTSSVYH